MQISCFHHPLLRSGWARSDLFALVIVQWPDKILYEQEKQPHLNRWWQSALGNSTPLKSGAPEIQVIKRTFQQPFDLQLVDWITYGEFAHNPNDFDVFLFQFFDDIQYFLES